IHTNQGRNFVLRHPLEPSQPEDPPRNPIYRLLVTLPEDQPCRTFYTSGPFTPSWFLFEDILHHPLNKYIQLHLRSPDIRRSFFECYYTSAKLDGVREITPCYSSWNTPDTITGLLLAYFDGSRRSVGQVRLDLLGTTRKVTTETMLIMFPSSDPLSVPLSVPSSVPLSVPLAENVKEWQSGIESYDFVETIPPDEEDQEDQEKNRRLIVPMRGRLDWVMYCYKSRITHHENDKPRDEMRQVFALEENQRTARSTPVRRSLSMVIGRT
ncbi:hypothetical protein ACHAPA_001403, partial [Fusarium lateritium]